MPVAFLQVIPNAAEIIGRLYRGMADDEERRMASLTPNEHLFVFGNFLKTTIADHRPCRQQRRAVGEFVPVKNHHAGLMGFDAESQLVFAPGADAIDVLLRRFDPRQFGPLRIFSFPVFQRHQRKHLEHARLPAGGAPLCPLKLKNRLG